MTLTNEDMLALSEMIDQKLTPINYRLDGIDQRLDGMDQRFDGIDQRLDGMDQRFDGIDRRLDGMDQRFDGIDRRLDDMDQRFDNLESQMKQIESTLKKEIRESEHSVLDEVERVHEILMRHTADRSVHAVYKPRY